MRRLLAALLTLTLAGPVAAAERDYYEYVRVFSTPPKTCDSPCEVEWSVTLPGIPLLVAVKQCLGGPELVRDRFLTAYVSGLGLGEGRIRILIGDSHPGRSQTFCARLVYLPLPEGEE